MRRSESSEVLIVGLGQIGGSIALALKKYKPSYRVVGFDIDDRVRQSARRRHVIDESVKSIAQAVSRADLIVLSTPIRKIVQLLPEIAHLAKESTVVIDVASTKKEILRVATQLRMSNFIGGHPITGNERVGLKAASEDKFQEKVFVLTPGKLTSGHTVRVASGFVRTLGATPLVMSADQHDKALALTSALPHAIALALTRLTQRGNSRNPNLRKLSGGSFAGATRVASSPEHLIADLLLTNREAVSRNLANLIAELQTIKKAVDLSNESRICKYISSVHGTKTKPVAERSSRRGGMR